MKTVMILGGAKGVGKEILKSCIEKGYNVAFSGRDATIANQLINSLNAKNKLYFHELDLNKIDEIGRRKEPLNTNKDKNSKFKWIN